MRTEAFVFRTLPDLPYVLFIWKFICILYHAGLPDAQMVKNLPAMQETRAQSLGQEDDLEKGTAIHSSILAWRIPWTEETS